MAVRKKSTKGKPWRNVENLAFVHGLRVMKISRKRKSGRKNVSYIQLSRRFVPTRTPDQIKTKLKNLEKSYDRAIKQSSHDSDWEEDQPKYMRELVSLWSAPSAPSTPDTDDDASSGTVHEFEPLDVGDFDYPLDSFSEGLTFDGLLSAEDLLSSPLDGGLVVG